MSRWRIWLGQRKTICISSSFTFYLHPLHFVIRLCFYTILSPSCLYLHHISLIKPLFFFLHHHILKHVLFYSKDNYTHGYNAVLARFKTEIENNCLSTSFLILSCGALSLRRLCRRMFASSILALKKFSLLINHLFL